MLDTNALSAFADGDAALEPLVAAEPLLYLPIPVLGEYRFGLCFSRQRKNYEAWLVRHLPDFALLVLEEETTHFYAAVRAELKTAGTPIPENDIWIAALTRQHSLTILSRDTHFDYVRGLRRAAW